MFRVLFLQQLLSWFLRSWYFSHFQEKDRMPTLLRAILSLKAVPDNENIFRKMDSYSKKRKKKINILREKTEVSGKFFLQICLPKQKIDEQLSQQCLFKQVFERGQQDRTEEGSVSQKRSFCVQMQKMECGHLVMHSYISTPFLNHCKSLLVKNRWIFSGGVSREGEGPPPPPHNNRP